MDSVKRNETLSAGFLKVFFAILFWNGLLFLCLRNKLPIVTDFVNSYSPLAVNLLNGRGYTLEGVFYAHHPPLLPLMLAVCYKLSGDFEIQNLVYPIVILVIQSLSCALLYRLVCGILDARAALLSAALLATHPFFIVLSATRYAWNAMPLALFFLIISARYFLSGLKNEKTEALFASGFSLGLAGLTWSGFAYGPIPFLFYMIGMRAKESRIWLYSLFFIIGFLLPVGSWSVYASHKTGKTTFISSAADASMIDGLVRHDNSKLRNYATVQRAKERRGQGELQTSKAVMMFYKDEIKESPVDFTRWALYKASRAWYGTDSEKHEKFNLLIQLPYIFLGFYGLFLFIKERKKETWLFLGFIFYFWVISFFVLTTIRYMMPAFMLWMIFAGYGTHHFLRKFNL